MDLHFSTADHCGGILYGPYRRKEAFAIQQQMRDRDAWDRQDVFLVLSIGNRLVRLIQWKCKGI
jgi:hypothetical protein